MLLHCNLFRFPKDNSKASTLSLYCLHKFRFSTSEVSLKKKEEEEDDGDGGQEEEEERKEKIVSLINYFRKCCCFCFPH